MCKGFSSLPSSCLVKAKEMRVKLSHLADAHHKPKVQNEKGFQDLEALLNNKSGLQAFRGFLRSEFSEENLKFWLACEDYRGSPSKTKASSIYGQFINPDALQEVSARVRRERHRAWSSSVWSKPAAPPLPQVNLDAETREALLKAMDSVGADRFNEAQQRIYSLMAKDSFPRFLRSSQCTEAITAF
ncbi:regulator of G-protein signaling 5 isoform X1 [Nelusetta ayraudi]|uniref:regulator of G-protein signaling 5 isoform X1 n=1 Tax=Nelusetta ayraudi TaxID=303726 RepID=UPI003F714826